MARDEQIKSDVLDALKWNPEVETSEIGVIVKDGAVTLTGTVASYPVKVAAEQAAKKGQRRSRNRRRDQGRAGSCEPPQ